MRGLKRWLLVTLLLVSSGCSLFSPTIDPSPHLPPLPPRMTRQQAEDLVTGNKWPEVLAEIQRRDEAIKALVLEGAWAEGHEERLRLLGEAR